MNGYEDHVHCLIALKPDQTIAKVIQFIKGESSFWINRNNLCSSRFEWQDEYFATSVSNSELNMTRGYIMNQEKHHMKKTFLEECNELLMRQSLPANNSTKIT